MKDRAGGRWRRHRVVRIGPFVLLFPLAVLSFIFAPAVYGARGKAALRAVEFAVGKEVRQRRLVGRRDHFALYDRVFAWFHVVGGPAERVEVVWQHEGEEVYTHRLPIESASWRSWAYKTVHLPGEWVVTLLDAEGEILRETTFTVSEEMRPEAWAGRYAFTEDSPNSDDFGVHVFHELRIFEEGGAWWAVLQATGPRSGLRFRCRVTMSGGEISLYLDETVRGAKSWAKGTLLLTLSRMVTPNGVGIVTRWGAYRPLLQPLPAEGSYFEAI